MVVLATLRSLLDIVFSPRADDVIVRALHASDVATLVAPTLIETRPPTTALMPWKDRRVRALIREAKYHDNRAAQTLLASALAEYLLAASEESFEKIVLVPLPLSKKRRSERGFNQCERIASLALKNALIPIDTTLLIRTKDTEHQARLARRERLVNVKDAFATTRVCNSSLTYILFDDVVTTGATIEAAAKALRAAGARHILPLALAYAD